MFSTSVSDVSLQEEHWEREAAAPLEKSVSDIGSFVLLCFQHNLESYESKKKMKEILNPKKTTLGVGL